MPSGRTHDRLTLWFLPPVGLATLGVTQGNGELTLLVSSGFLVGGLMLGPDLDIRSRQFKRWGWFRWIWLPYQKGLKHRSFWSHGPVVGTTLRVIYLLAWVGLCALLVLSALAFVHGLGNTGWNWRAVEGAIARQVLAAARWLFWDRGPEFWSFFIGLELGALLHSSSDWIGSSYKAARKRRGS